MAGTKTLEKWTAWMVPVTRTSRLARGDSTGAAGCPLGPAACSGGGLEREHEARSSNPAAAASPHDNDLISQIRRRNLRKGSWESRTEAVESFAQCAQAASVIRTKSIRNH